jgi:hypothetical protein
MWGKLTDETLRMVPSPGALTKETLEQVERLGSTPSDVICPGCNQPVLPLDDQKPWGYLDGVARIGHTACVASDLAAHDLGAP